MRFRGALFHEEALSSTLEAPFFSSSLLFSGALIPQIMAPKQPCSHNHFRKITPLGVGKRQLLPLCLNMGVGKAAENDLSSIPWNH